MTKSENPKGVQKTVGEAAKAPSGGGPFPSCRRARLQLTQGDLALHDSLDRFRDAPFACKEFHENRARWGCLHPKEQTKSWAELRSASSTFSARPL